MVIVIKKNINNQLWTFGQNLNPSQAPKAQNSFLAYGTDRKNIV